MQRTVEETYRFFEYWSLRGMLVAVIFCEREEVGSGKNTCNLIEYWTELRGK